jgi:hypothetical protein
MINLHSRYYKSHSKIKTMKRLSILLSSAVLLPCLSMAQNEVDMLRYSQLTFGGTARSVGMAGAFGALGADASTLSSNPAGIGLYRKSELSLTPAFFNQRTTSVYNGNTNVDSKANFYFSNWGMVFTSKIGKDDDLPEWKNVSFGIAYNRSNDFNNRFVINGNNGSSSLLDVYLKNANGSTPDNLDPFTTNLAFQTYLLDTVPGYDNRYFSQVPFGGMAQRKSVTTTGGMGETAITFGGNYSNKLYIGGTFGIGSVRYSETSSFEETDEKDTILNIKNYQLIQDISTTGRGFNAKFGMIYRPFDFVRIGAAVHSATYYSLTDNYSSSIDASYDDGNTFSSNSPDGSYNYSVTTPFRAIGSVGFVIGKIALIDADYEYVDYSAGRLRGSDYSFFNENEAAQTKYRPTANIRVGAEVKLNPVSLRAGYALYGSPYKAGINDGAHSSYTFGIGFKDEFYFVDLACVLSDSKEKYYIYDPKLVNATNNTMKTANILATVGFKF